MKIRIKTSWSKRLGDARGAGRAVRFPSHGKSIKCLLSIDPNRLISFSNSIATISGQVRLEESAGILGGMHVIWIFQPVGQLTFTICGGFLKIGPVSGY